MKKLTLILLLLSSFALSGCEFTTDQQRTDYITETLKTREIWWREGRPASFYVVRAPDGSVWIIDRAYEGKVEELTRRQIFGPLTK